MRLQFPIILIDEQFRRRTEAGSGISPLVNAIERTGAEVIGLADMREAAESIQRFTRASAFIVSLDDACFAGESMDDTFTYLRNLIGVVRARDVNVPVFLKMETKTTHHVPGDVLSELHGILHKNEDTVEFIARYVVREARAYMEQLPPPFFRALTRYTEDGSYSWHCPGHSGGVAFLKSPVGHLFHEFFGENMLRADVCNAVDDLGQLLDHTGPVKSSEQQAAKIFSADHLFFVTNGTSSSNKIVWHSVVAPGDVVVVDRNCHKSVLHAIIMTGAIPVFLKPERNYLGIIGPIPEATFSRQSIQNRIDRHPLARHVKKAPRILALTQCTYDGILYNAESIKRRLDGFIDALHFDEAWSPHAAFHDFYGDFHALGEEGARCEHSMVFSTQSTHKLLAGLSQASQILVQEPQQRNLDRHRFNESYLMHSSTSPHYPIIASCDMTAAMMAKPGGTALLEETIVEAMAFRRAMRAVADPDDWWFTVWGPDHLGDDEFPDPSDWFIRSGEAWHGFRAGGQAEFNMLDPTRATILTPGLDLDGRFADAGGIPGAVLAKYLAEHGVIVEKVGLYSLLVMFTIGITKGRWNTLVTELQRFKKAFDTNRPIHQVMPRFAAQTPRYAEMSLQELCLAIHQCYRHHDIARLMMTMYEEEPIPVMTPAKAYSDMAHGAVERVPLDSLEGQVSSMLVTPYPPGIPLLVPGEQFTRSIIDYLCFARGFNEQFPGFETSIHGLVTEKRDGKNHYYVDCVSRPASACQTVQPLEEERRFAKVY